MYRRRGVIRAMNSPFSSWDILSRCNRNNILYGRSKYYSQMKIMNETIFTKFIMVSIQYAIILSNEAQRQLDHRASRNQVYDQPSRQQLDILDHNTTHLNNVHNSSVSPQDDLRLFWSSKNISLTPQIWSLPSYVLLLPLVLLSSTWDCHMHMPQP